MQQSVVGNTVNLLTYNKLNACVCFEVLGYFEVHIPVGRSFERFYRV